ncbi:MAG: beta-propeller domain-containing protein, partial [Pirellulales bacterium]
TKGSVETYSSKDSLYVFDTYASETRIMKVSFDASGGEITVTPAATGTVQGRFLNQFAASEHDGCLRLVVGNRSRGSSVIVLEQDGEQLTETGRLDGLARGEDLYSVRFTDSRVYIVTFLRVDPLFVVDLVDHTSPTLLGELKIPGFSDHIEILDKHHLLAIGYDAGYLQVSIFDVSDPTQPRLRHRYTLPGMRNTSTAVTGRQARRGDGDHLALGFFPELGIMTMPTEQNSGGWWGRYARKQQLNVLSIDVQTGVSHRGVIDHETEVTRAAYIDSHLVATSSTKVTTHSLSSPTDIVGTAQLHDVGILSVVELPIKKIDPVVAASGDSGSAPRGDSFFNLWTPGETQEIDGQQTLFAEHKSGARHQMKLTGKVSGNTWALFGFNDISNQDSRVLESEARNVPSERQDKSSTIENRVHAGLSEFELTISGNDKDNQSKGVFFAVDSAK